MSECSHDFDSNELSNYCAKGCGETWALYTIKNLQKESAILRETLEEIKEYKWCPNCKNEESRGIAEEALEKVRSEKAEGE